MIDFPSSDRRSHQFHAPYPDDFANGIRGINKRGGLKSAPFCIFLREYTSRGILGDHRSAISSGIGRLLWTMAQTITTSQQGRDDPWNVLPADCTMTGAANRLTRLTTLIIGFKRRTGSILQRITYSIANHTGFVPFRAFAGIRIQVRGSSSIDFLALSQAPPALDMNTASS